MEWIDDSFDCLEAAELQLDEIVCLVKESVKNEKLVSRLRTTIKSFLESCRSPLDYTANFLFNTYCSQSYNKKELDRKKVYFPVSRNEKQFSDCIDKNFRNLNTSNPDIVQLLRNAQSFSETAWLSTLTTLLNENKHKNLTKHKVDRTTYIKNGELGGIIFKDVTIVNCAIPIMFNDIPIDFINPTPYDHHFNASVEFEYFFVNGNLPVLPTLREIYDGVYKTICEFRLLYTK